MESLLTHTPLTTSIDFSASKGGGLRALSAFSYLSPRLTSVIVSPSVTNKREHTPVHQDKTVVYFCSCFVSLWSQLTQKLESVLTLTLTPAEESLNSFA